MDIIIWWCLVTEYHSDQSTGLTAYLYSLYTTNNFVLNDKNYICTQNASHFVNANKHMHGLLMELHVNTVNAKTTIIDFKSNLMISWPYQLVTQICYIAMFH